MMRQSRYLYLFMSSRFISRLGLLGAVLFWLLFTVLDVYQLFTRTYQMEVALSTMLPQWFFTFFVLSLAVRFRYKLNKAESVNFLDLLWKVFMVGLVTTIAALAIRLTFTYFGATNLGQNPIFINALYHLLVGLVMIFLVFTLEVWKRLILYQKSKSLLQLWSFFEYALIASLIFDLLEPNFRQQAYQYVLVFVIGFSVILVLNLKWVAYLNFKQKLKSILFIVLSAIYLYHFLVSLIQFSATDALAFDLYNRTLTMALFIFSFLYAGISVLVTLFNLPTSSVFERKLKEAVDFQKLSQAIPSGQSEEQTYEILLESSMSATFADAAYLEVRTDDFPDGIYYSRDITHGQIAEIKRQVKVSVLHEIIHFGNVRMIPSSRLTGRIKVNDFKSILALPVMVKNKQLGSLVLLRDVADSFNRELVEIIITFVNQASISIENFMLLSDALENERYQEQLKIAKDVQRSLLPDQLASDENFEITAFSMAADEVGGDYYDIIHLEDGLFGLIIGDVSGKGTSAAFHMAQMKGIFHSLALPEVEPKEFIVNANLALGKCLERHSFITASYFWIDTRHCVLRYVRAGHIPALFFRASDRKVLELKPQGMGLGIVRNFTFHNYVESATLTYQEGDVLVLITDGITEAKNQLNQQFSMRGLKQSLLSRHAENAMSIKEGIIQDLKTFLGDQSLIDDYTLVIVKFKNGSNNNNGK